MEIILYIIMPIVSWIGFAIWGRHIMYRKLLIDYNRGKLITWSYSGDIALDEMIVPTVIGPFYVVYHFIDKFLSRKNKKFQEKFKKRASELNDI